ncbi:hypothetical protein [Xylella fastidiosa]|uniref:hypothetical protein n=1 Tax=Xylella fastidiosa TaxID=2371 RepID=UPI001CA3F6C4|nr:hypothetical protein [Xylella fastidiosa]
MASSVSEQAHQKVNHDESGTLKAPLFGWGHHWGYLVDGDVEGRRNRHVAWFFRETSSRSPEGTILVVSDYLSPMVRSWFENTPDGDIQRDSKRMEYLRVFPTHPLYLQVKQACGGQQARYGDAENAALMAKEIAMSTLPNANEKAQPNPAISAPTEAPPLDLDGLKAAGIETLIGGFHIRGAKGLKGTFEILSSKSKRFSPLMRSWFKGRQDSEIKFSFGSEQECIRVHTTHPLYTHVCAAYTINEVIANNPKLRFKASAEAVEKESEDASKEVAA